jgi:hypothetical protein
MQQREGASGSVCAGGWGRGVAAGAAGVGILPLALQDGSSIMEGLRRVDGMVDRVGKRGARIVCGAKGGLFGLAWRWKWGLGWATWPLPLQISLQVMEQVGWRQVVRGWRRCGGGLGKAECGHGPRGCQYSAATVCHIDCLHVPGWLLTSVLSSYRGLEPPEQPAKHVRMIHRAAWSRGWLLSCQACTHVQSVQ